ncbi:unnamed protein product [Lymnaea stagnalis]|uniref:Uncharacterized protein n=1 Tax=Lymnaea stagnalis TaxID=6523 RepID=A0AAV2HR94_LYMST
MSVIMTKANPGLTCQLQAASHSQRRTQLDSADLVVLFISDLFISSQHLVEELHTVLCRQRTTKDRTILYLMQCDHNAAAPFYFHLLPFSISLDDNIWRRLERASSNKNPRYDVDIAGMAGTYRCTAAQNLALTAAAHDAAYVLSQAGSGSSVRCSLDNIACLESDLEGAQDDLVSAKDHIVMLTSFGHMMSRQHTISPSLKPVIKSSSPAGSDVNLFLTDSNDDVSSLPSEDVSSNISNNVEMSMSTIILTNEPSEIGSASENKAINQDQASTLGEKQPSRLDLNSHSTVDQINTGGRLPETTSGAPSTKGLQVQQQEQPTKRKQVSGTCCVL